MQQPVSGVSEALEPGFWCVRGRWSVIHSASGPETSTLFIFLTTLCVLSLTLFIFSGPEGCPNGMTYADDLKVCDLLATLNHRPLMPLYELEGGVGMSRLGFPAAVFLVVPRAGRKEMCP